MFCTYRCVGFAFSNPSVWASIGFAVKKMSGWGSWGGIGDDSILGRRRGLRYALATVGNNVRRPGTRIACWVNGTEGSIYIFFAPWDVAKAKCGWSACVW